MGRKRSGRKVAPDLTEKFFASIQSAARQEDATTGANVRTGRINGAFKTNSRADIQRDYASTPDNMEYAVIAGGNKPKADDPVLFIDGEGGPVIIGRPWRPGERDLEQVDTEVTEVKQNKYDKSGGQLTGKATYDQDTRVGNQDGQGTLTDKKYVDDGLGGKVNSGVGHYHLHAENGAHTHKTGYYWVAKASDGYLYGDLEWFGPGQAANNGGTSSSDGAHAHGTQHGGNNSNQYRTGETTL